MKLEDTLSIDLGGDSGDYESKHCVLKRRGGMSLGIRFAILPLLERRKE